MKTTPWKEQEILREGDDYPAMNVSWDDAIGFCKQLSKQDGREYRLPTEAEWEYSCRAGTVTAHSFGDDIADLGEYAWFASNAWDVDEAYAHKVSQKVPNPWGLYDMHGNVDEWCSDWYPFGPVAFSSRVVRGGGWFNFDSSCRSARRNYEQPFNTSTNNGFRVVSIVSGKE